MKQNCFYFQLKNKWFCLPEGSDFIADDRELPKNFRIIKNDKVDIALYCFLQGNTRLPCIVSKTIFQCINEQMLFVLLKGSLKEVNLFDHRFETLTLDRLQLW